MAKKLKGMSSWAEVEAEFGSEEELFAALPVEEEPLSSNIWSSVKGFEEAFAGENFAGWCKKQALKMSKNGMVFDYGADVGRWVKEEDLEKEAETEAETEAYVWAEDIKKESKKIELELEAIINAPDIIRAEKISTLKDSVDKIRSAVWGDEYEAWEINKQLEEEEFAEFAEEFGKKMFSEEGFSKEEKSMIGWSWSDRKGKIKIIKDKINKISKNL